MRCPNVRRLTSIAFAAALLSSCVIALGIEQIFFGYDEDEPLMTDNIRGSTPDRIGVRNLRQRNAERKADDEQYTRQSFHRDPFSHSERRRLSHVEWDAPRTT